MVRQAHHDSVIIFQRSLTINHYQDKIAYISGTSASFSDVNSLIEQYKTKNADAIILNLFSLPNAVLGSGKDERTLMLLSQFAQSAKQNNLFLFVNIDLASIGKQNWMKRNKTYFSRMIKETELDGICFTGIDFNSELNYELMEDIIVEAMMIKPFLSITTTVGISKTNSSFVNELLKNGIIDFLFDETFDFSITTNEIIGASNEKLLPIYLKRLQPEFFYSLDLSKVAEKNDSEIFIPALNKTKLLDARKCVNFILTTKSDSLKLSVGNKTINISKADWAIPYNYVLNKDNSVSRTGNWIEFRRPFEKRTHSGSYNLLCRTNYPATVSINGKSVKQYTTGIFFDKIKLQEGLNRLRAEAKDSKGYLIVYEDRVYYQPKTESSEDNVLQIDETTIKPAENLTLSQKDFLNISFNGTKEQKGIVVINPGSKVFECLRKDNKNFSTYQVQIPLKDFLKNEKHSIKLILKPADENSKLSDAEISWKNNFVIKEEADFPSLVTTNKNSLLTYTLAPIRLGAPLRNELPKDVILKSSGIFGDYYRIRLNDTEEGYISKEFVKELPGNTPLPNYFINSISTYPDKAADIVKIPYLENVPFDVYPDPNQKRIVINLYGVKTSSTWIIHQSSLKLIEEINWQQVDKGTYRIFVNLKTSKIWGYELKPNGKELVFKVKHPPIYNLKNEKPLKGIKISIEAGHGGSNFGAVSLSGIKEKDINLDLSLKLEKLFKKYGAEVHQVRDSDKDMSLIEKRDIAIGSNADIHLSIHANASEPVNEFLGASGTCTFYHNPFWAKFSEAVFDKLVELKLKPFGSVGSFNYRVTRMTEMPSILVEMAFMSHAEDEEKLADENFRAKMAQKIYDGLINYLKYKRE
ncbi:MAG: hypothetical protein FD188_3034 [Ignavibacteria bacterium]|nr:MAG: hypothetical protein FD188_3034 [Ignavibacteria bacterium]